MDRARDFKVVMEDIEAEIPALVKAEAIRLNQFALVQASSGIGSDTCSGLVEQTASTEAEEPTRLMDQLDIAEPTRTIDRTDSELPT